MVSAFGRSLSFSNSPKPKPNYHVRSISLPSRSNPALSQVESEIHSVRAWLARSDPSSASLCAGLAQLALLLDSFHDLLSLPHFHSSLRRACSVPLLDQFLYLADACGSFRSSTITLKQLSSDAQVAIRANDTPRVLSCLRAVKRVEKELCLKAKIKVKVSLESGLSGEELEMAAVMREVVGVIMAGLGSVFAGMVGECATSAAMVVEGWTGSWVVSKMRRKGVREDWKRNGLEKLGELEECVEILESRVERVFRSLVNARVSLLNILTPCV
ncbi:hypothetical protein DsansV1_C05g0056241 [Dioscorea sansibarensis]